MYRKFYIVNLNFSVDILYLLCFNPDMANAIPSKRIRKQTRAAYVSELPSLRAKYRATIAQAAGIANKIFQIEEQSRAAEGQQPYGKAANQ